MHMRRRHGARQVGFEGIVGGYHSFAQPVF